jgi:hypothetical protein
MSAATLMTAELFGRMRDRHRCLCPFSIFPAFVSVS